MSIPSVALKPVSCGTTVWWRGGVLQVTVAVKATFGMMHDANARLIAPLPIVTEDRHHPGGSVAEPSDVAPYLPTAGVVLTGSACASRPAPAMTIRLAVFRERPLVEKSLHVFGDRPPGARDPQPFQQLPIVWERAYGGPAFPDNPVGTGAAAERGAPPNFVDPADPRRPAGFGPLPRHWGARRRLLGSRGEPTAELPDGFDFRWFHAAPPDQQCDYFQGDEWIVLDGMHPTLPRLQTHLPGVHAEAVWVASLGGRPPEGRLLRLAADTLLIDADRQLCSLVWRGHFALEQADALPSVRVFAGVAMAGYPMSWPDEACLGPARAPDPKADPDRAPTERIKISKVKMPTLPFTKAPPGDVGARFPAPPPRELPELNSTVAAVSPFAAGGSALPFAKGGGPPVVAPPSPKASLGGTETSVTSPFAALPFGPAREEPPASRPPASVPAAKSVWADDDSSTRMIDPAQIMAGAQSSWSAPFAIPGPGASKPSAAPSVAPLPGAPWSNVAAAEVVKGDPSASTVAVRASDVLRAVAQKVDPPAPPPVASPPPMVAPPPMAAPPLMVAPPPMVAAPPMVAPPPPVAAPPIAPPAVVAPPPLAPPAAVAPPPSAPAVAPPPVAPPPILQAPPSPPEPPPSSAAAAPPPAETAPATGVRAAVIARLKAREPLVDLQLAGADLHDLDLSGMVLSGLDLRGAKLSRARLVGARLGDAKLGDADLTDADLTQADLTRADLSRAALGGARLDGALLADANLAGARGPGAHLEGVKAGRARLARGEWNGATFAGADLTGADLTGASLAEARFTGATLIEARLGDAQGRGAVFDDARLPGALAQGAAFPAASFRGADAARSAWENATLDQACFAGATLTDANLSRASCQKADFTGAALGGANLQRLTGDGAVLREARLANADLRQARLREAAFGGAELRGLIAGKADLTGGRFERADLEGASLRGARLGEASFAHANLEGADLRDAVLDRTNVFGASRKTAKIAASSAGLVEVDPGTT